MIVEHKLGKYFLESWPNIGAHTQEVSYFRERTERKILANGWVVRRDDDMSGSLNLCVCQFEGVPDFYVIPADADEDDDPEYPIGPFSTPDDALRMAIVLYRMERTE